MYKQVWFSMGDESMDIRTDILQRVHTSYNFAKVISLWSDIVEEDDEIREVLEEEDINSVISEMKRNCDYLCDNYLHKFPQIIENCKHILIGFAVDINEMKSNFKYKDKCITTSDWWHYILEYSKVPNIVFKIKESLMNAPGSTILKGNSVSDR